LEQPVFEREARKPDGTDGKQAEFFFLHIYPLRILPQFCHSSLKTLRGKKIIKRNGEGNMKRKIVGIVLLMLVTTTVVSATGALNAQRPWLIHENNYSQSYQNTPTDSKDIIGVKIQGKVYEVTDPYNLLGGAIKVNDTVKGKYVYNIKANDTSLADPKHGLYLYYSSPCGIEATLGNFIFKTDPNNREFIIITYNDIVEEPYPGDAIEIGSLNCSDLSNGLKVTLIDWALYDPTGTALSSDALLTTAPDLSDWKQSDGGFGLQLQGKSPTNASMTFSIKAEITKATKGKARDIDFTTHPLLLWLLERFPNIFPILRHLMERK